MIQNMKQSLAELARMSPAQLRQKHIELFGEISRSGNRDYLFKRLAWRMQSLAEGGLSERARKRAEELARDADVRMTMPRTLQASVKPRPAATDPRLPMAGTVLTRRYREQQIEVTVLPTGFLWQGQTHRSLSAVAKAVTGSHWNGRLFFGLKGKP